MKFELPKVGSPPPRRYRLPCQVPAGASRSEEHTSELQSQSNLVCRLLLEKKKKHSCHDNPPDARSLISPSDVAPSIPSRCRIPRLHRASTIIASSTYNRSASAQRVISTL